MSARAGIGPTAVLSRWEKSVRIVPDADHAEGQQERQQPQPLAAPSEGPFERPLQRRLASLKRVPEAILAIFGDVELGLQKNRTEVERVPVGAEAKTEADCDGSSVAHNLLRSRMRDLVSGRQLGSTY